LFADATFSVFGIGLHMTLRVLVSTLAGKALELELEPLDVESGRKVLELKTAIASSAWGFPHSFQTLVGANSLHVPQDFEPIAQSHYLLVLSLDMVLQTLKAGSGSQRRDALRDLGKLGARAGDTAAAAVVSCLADPDLSVRLAAAHAIAGVVERGDKRALSALISCLSDHAWGVRHAAVRAIGRIARGGDRRSLAALIACFRDHRGGVRLASVSAIAGIAERGDQCTLAAVIAQLANGNAGVRQASLQAIGLIAGADDLQTISAAAALLDDSAEEVRCEAVQAIAQIAANGRLHPLATVDDGNTVWAAVRAVIQRVGACQT